MPIHTAYIKTENGYNVKGYVQSWFGNHGLLELNSCGDIAQCQLDIVEKIKNSYLCENLTPPSKIIHHGEISNRNFENNIF